MNALARFANDWSQISVISPFVGQGSETQLQVGDLFFQFIAFPLKVNVHCLL